MKENNGKPILEIKNLVKQYPGVRAVDGISFAIRPGICFGLLGPNGAGKTTTIEMVEGIIKPTSGEIFYKGAPRDGHFKQEVGIQFQSTALFNFQTVKESLTTFHNLYQEPASLESVIQMCRLEDIIDRDNSKISGGQRQRLLLAMALINNPSLIFLDEPTTGLDPQARRHLWEIVTDIKEQGKTVVLTTHYMEEAQFLCDEIVIIDHGRIIAMGTPESLLAEHAAGGTVSIPVKDLPGPPEEIFNNPETLCTDCKLTETRKRYEFYTTRIHDCLNRLMEQRIDLTRISVRPQNLEDLFLKLTGHRLRD